MRQSRNISFSRGSNKPTGKRNLLECKRISFWEQEEILQLSEKKRVKDEKHSAHGLQAISAVHGRIFSAVEV